MSFSDLMSSAKGPGVIGLLLALVVLGGFIILGTVTLDPQFQGGKSIESEIRDQSRTIEDQRFQLRESESRLVEFADRINLAKNLTVKETEVARLQATLAEKKLAEALANEEFENTSLSFEDYKSQYRAQVRSEAKGKKLQNFETLDGKKYHDVIIREVNPIGILINHQDGSKRIAYADLPTDMQDLYQFDPDEKRKQEEAELLRKKKHLLANDAFQRAKKQDAAQNREQEARAEDIRRQHAIASLDTRRNNLSNQIESLERDIQAESYKRISRAPIMREQLVKLRSELQTLDAKILSLRSTN